MKNTTIGVDSSLNSPSSTFTIEDSIDGPVSSVPDTLRLTPDELEKDRGEVMSHAVHDITVPSLRMLLTQVLNVIDIAIPNKDQNKAVKRTIREDFDTAYFGILGRAYPNSQFGKAEGSYALAPMPTKDEIRTLK